MPRYLLAHDLGTSADKAVLFDEEGHILGSETAPYPTHSPHPGWHEQNPQDWWDAVVTTTGKLLRGREAERIAAVSFSDQMHGCVPVNRKGEPLLPNMIWSDQRAEPQTRRLVEKVGEPAVYRICGHRPSSSYTLSKWMWIRDTHPEVYRDTHKILQAKEFIIHRLTGAFATEQTDATGTNLYDLTQREWSGQILEWAELDGEKLPRCGLSTDVVGYITAEAARQTGIPKGVPVVCGGGDGAMATVGAGCIHSGETYASMGTSAYIATTSESPIFDPDMTTFNYAHVLAGQYIPCGAMSACGQSFAWARDVMCERETEIARESGRGVYPLLDELVRTSPPGAGGLLFLPYLAGERSPRWNPDARGAFIGLTSAHTKADMLRSVLEGVAMNLELIFRVFRTRLPIDALTLIGGGSSGDVWSGIMADVLHIPVRKLNVTEYATSIGAAITAGVGVGLFADFNSVRRFVHTAKTIPPNPATRSTYEQMQRLFDRSYNQLTDVFTGLAALGR